MKKMNADWIFQKKKNPKRIFFCQIGEVPPFHLKNTKATKVIKSLRGKPSGILCIFYLYFCNLCFSVVSLADTRRFAPLRLFP